MQMQISKRFGTEIILPIILIISKSDGVVDEQSQLPPSDNLINHNSFYWHNAQHGTMLKSGWLYMSARLKDRQLLIAGLDLSLRRKSCPIAFLVALKSP